MSRPAALAPTPELGWLIAACRSFLGGEAPAKTPPDWRELGRLSFLHQLDPLLHHLRGRGALGAAQPPGALARQWEEALYRNYIFNAELIESAAELIERCRRRSLRVAVFKGPVTAVRGYGALELRIMADLDLLCHPDDLGGVAEAARAGGYRAAEQTADYHLGFLRPALGAGLEIHFRLYDLLPSSWLREELWADLEPVRIDDIELPAPAPARAAVLDLAHLLQHDLRVQLRLLLDLACGVGAVARTGADGRMTALLQEAGLTDPMSRLSKLFRDRFGWPVTVSLPAAAGTRRLSDTVLEGLHQVDRLGRRPLLAGPHRKAGALASGRYLLRRLLPSPRQLQALHGSRSRAAALLHLPGHVATTTRRAWRRWRRGGLVERGGSVKRDLYGR